MLTFPDKALTAILNEMRSMNAKLERLIEIQGAILNGSTERR